MFALSTLTLLLALYLLARSRQLPPIARRPVRLVASYYLVAFVVRSVLLVLANPVPQYGNALADPLLYAEGYVRALPIMVFQTAIAAICIYTTYCVLARQFWATAEHSGRLEAPKAGSSRGITPTAILAVYLICYSFRLYVLVTQGRHDDVADVSLASFGKLSAACSIWVIWAVMRKLIAWRNGHRVVFATLIVGEAFWAIMNHSKTPVVALLVAVYLALWNQSLSRRSLVITGAVLVATFAVIGSLRSSVTANANSDIATIGQRPYQPFSNNSTLRYLTKPLYQIIVRADGIESLARVNQAGPGSYLTPHELVGTTIGVAVPAVVTHAKNEVPGQLWASRYFNYKNATSLAEGLAAEGFGVAGYPGIVIWALLAGMLLAIASWWAFVARGVTLQLCGASLLASPVFFERGLLGIIQGLVDTIEVSMLLTIIVLILRTYAQTSRHNIAPRPQWQFARSVA